MPALVQAASDRLDAEHFCIAHGLGAGPATLATYADALLDFMREAGL